MPDNDDTEYVLRGDDGEVISRSDDAADYGYDEDDDITGLGVRPLVEDEKSKEEDFLGFDAL